MNATVDSALSGQYAGIDDQGRYKVRLPFDMGPKNNMKASRWVRMAQPYAGPGYGSHFPLHKNTEVVLSFIDGNHQESVGADMSLTVGAGRTVNIAAAEKKSVGGSSDTQVGGTRTSSVGGGASMENVASALIGKSITATRFLAKTFESIYHVDT